MKWYKRIKYFIQRGKRGYADCDIWWMGTYILRLEADMLLTLRDKHSGIPYPINDWDESMEVQKENCKIIDQMWKDYLFDLSVHIKALECKVNYNHITNVELYKEMKPFFDIYGYYWD